jgi:hypothetical protein
MAVAMNNLRFASACSTRPDTRQALAEASAEAMQQLG